MDDWKQKYLRALADYQNLEKRAQEEKRDMRTLAAEIVLLKILPAVDTLVKAKEHVKDPGLDLAYKKFEEAFEELGLKKMEVVGKQFNPHEMECVEVVDGADNMVIVELLPGYRLHDKIVRVAHVKVGKKKEDSYGKNNRH